MTHGAAATSLRPMAEAHAPKSGCEQSSPPMKGGQSHRPSSVLHTPFFSHPGLHGLTGTVWRGRADVVVVGGGGGGGGGGEEEAAAVAAEEAENDDDEEDKIGSERCCSTSGAAAPLVTAGEPTSLVGGSCCVGSPESTGSRRVLVLTVCSAGLRPLHG